ncbi:hydrogen gas-evolving membrane-bound hydrogenase subunit E [Streptomyces sp. GD-15H]|uniref:hydrogen gas-evolving membrane-bound hydrogenase subunit E n=1 Tax=Streptomyces sp. GD-15H TaxID=3129112 RepID=UPI0032441DAE
MQHAYDRAIEGVDRLAVTLTRHTQVGSLPAYLTVLLATVIAVPGAALVAAAPSLGSPPLWRYSLEPVLAVVMLAAAAAVVAARHRLTAVLLTGAVGYGAAGLFLVRGAPDLALTQFLVETMTLVVVVLVLRRMPARFDPGRRSVPGRVLRGAVAVGVGAVVTCFALAAASARTAPVISPGYLRRAAETGAYNVVNAIIVDFRALDTLGEISVVLVAAVGVGSLVRFRDRGAVRAADEEPPARFPTTHWDEPRQTWLPGAGERPGGERSVLLEVAIRLLFPSILVLSLFLLFSGHYRPGGGFSGGLVAGLAFVLRYLVGGQADLGAAVRLRPVAVAGTGLVIAAVVGLAPPAVGGTPLDSRLMTWHLPLVGEVKWATSLFLDVGVYLLVVGVVLKLLSAVGVSLGEAGAAAAREGEGSVR